MRVKDIMNKGTVLRLVGKLNDLFVLYMKVLGIYYLVNLFFWVVL